MDTLSIKEQIASQLDRLSDEQQRQVLEFANRMTRPRGTPSDVLRQLVGTIPPDRLDEIERAIEDCESVDLDEW
jgi:hypothetical protein